jgi:hypothetical protein
MAGNTISKAQNKLYRLAYLGGIAAFFLPFFEPFLPLLFTIAGSLILGGLVRFIFICLANRKLNQKYRAYSSSRAHASGSNFNRQAGGADNNPLPPHDPLKPYRELFGLQPGFTRAQLKSAYHALAAKYHPDHYAASSPYERQNAEETMKKINEACDFLEKKTPA